MSLKFEIFDVDTGWATLRLHFNLGSKSRVITIVCSNRGGDSPGDLVRGFVQLVQNDGKKVEIDCYSEPGNSLISLKRHGEELAISIKRFTYEFDGAKASLVVKALATGKNSVWKKMTKSRNNRKTALKEKVPFNKAIATLISAFESIRESMGQERYESFWGFPYPVTELDLLRSYLTKDTSNDGK